MRRIHLTIASLKLEEPHGKECRWDLVADSKSQLTTSKEMECQFNECK